MFLRNENVPPSLTLPHKWGENRWRARSAVILLFRIDCSSERAGESPAVDQDILPGDIAGLRRAKESGHGAKFIGLADAFGRHRGDPFGERRIVADIFLLRRHFNVGTEAIGLERAG